jgi:hypothetical protein
LEHLLHVAANLHSAQLALAVEQVTHFFVVSSPLPAAQVRHVATALQVKHEFVLPHVVQVLSDGVWKNPSLHEEQVVAVVPVHVAQPVLQLSQAVWPALTI